MTADAPIDPLPSLELVTVPQDLAFLSQHATTLSRLGVLQPALRTALIEEALERAAIPMPPAQKQQALQERFWQQQRIPPQQRQRWLEQRGLSTDDISRIACRGWRWGQWCERRWHSKLESLFLHYKNQLDRATALFLELEEPGLARELYLQLSESEATFGELARRHCLNQPARRGGQIGPAALSELPPSLAELIRTSPLQVVREPVRLAPQRWVILRVEQFEAASLNNPAIPPRLFSIHGESRLQRKITDWFRQRQLPLDSPPTQHSPPD